MSNTETGANGAPAPPIAATGTVERASRDTIFFAAVEATRMPMVVADPRQPDMPIVFCNLAFLQLTGYEEEEVIGRNCRFLQGPGTDSATLDQIRDALRARREVHVEILNYKKDGTPFWNALFMSPVMSIEGELLYFFGSQLDVSLRRDAETVLRHTQRLDAIGQLTGGVAHDFNNLLQVIRGSVEAIRQKPGDTLSPRIGRLVDAIDEAARRGSTLTAQLLAFARRQHLSDRTLDLPAIVADAMPLIEQAVGDHIKVRIDTRCDKCRVRIDASQAELALLNVVFNARDAMPEGGTLSIVTEREKVTRSASMQWSPKPGDYAVLIVGDTGVGMTGDIAERATEPFFSTKAPASGTGLGLSMVAGFLEQSRGGLSFQTSPGKGTIVRMYFPMLTDADASGDHSLSSPLRT